MVVEAKKKVSPHWWWFDSYNNKDITSPRRSPWLQSTLSELDEKTKAMLRIIEEDADSFAQRAEMYYRKRPEIISMIEDFYRAHRSLAERYDQVKSDPGFRLITTRAFASPLSSKYPQEKSMMTCTEKSYDSYSETYDDPVESGESEVDDPEPEEGYEVEENDEEEEVSSEIVNGEVMRLREEIERLKQENKIQKEQIAEKDEEKREVIRQLSLAMDMLRQENVKLRKKCIAIESSPKKWSPQSDFNKLKGMFMGKLFNNGSPK